MAHIILEILPSPTDSEYISMLANAIDLNIKHQ